MTVNEFTFNKEEVRLMDSARCDLWSIISKLDAVLSVSAMNDIKKAYDKLERSQRRYLDADRKSFKEAMDYWDEMRQKNSLTSIWSMYEVGNDCNAVISEDILTALNQGAELHYQGITADTMVVHEDMSWLELWKEIDKLIEQSEDAHHLYIEAVEFDKSANLVRVWTGS